MTKKKIVILGGGMAGLSAAYQLTRTPALQAQHDVTLYQMGWRLGGKAASGRDKIGRNLEHGLHVWFGCYENTFQMVQEVYAARPNTVDWKIKTWQDAAKPQAFTPLGTKDGTGTWQYWPLTWAENEGQPGDGRLLPSIPEVIGTVIDWIYLFLSGKEEAGPAAAIDAAGPVPDHASVAARASDILRDAKRFIHNTIGKVGKDAGDDFEKAIRLIEWAHDAHRGTVGAGAEPGSKDAITNDILNIFLATVRGIFADLIFKNAPLISLDDMEFRAWLLKHGADPTIVTESTICRVPYDTLFQYDGGDITKPDMAAGTGLGAIMRLIGTYKGAMMWEVQAGMGEVIVGPLYQHLVNAGVSFKFFHKVTAIIAGTQDSSPVVASIELEQQAMPVSGNYDPVTVTDGMVVWPSEPYWEQLQNGTAMQQAGVNFESNWVNWPAQGPPVVLHNGEDFDTVVLAIALGALKKLNDEDASICASLIESSGAMENWINNVPLVPSMGVQIWSNRTTAALGWSQPKAACVSGPEYLNIWADMTQVLQYEPWAPPLVKPLSLHYLTGTYKTDFYKAPKSQTDTPVRAAADLWNQTVAWLNTSSYAAWPAAQTAEGFDWSVLSAPDDASGEDRLCSQYIRPNIDPTECCTVSAAGTTQYRLHADGSGFTNLVLAGEGTAMGLTTSFEGSIMSGSAASRAICGQPELIIGYDFLERKPSQGPGR